MFEDPQLQEHLEQSTTISSKARIIGEWNLNLAENIERVGNYRVRPAARSTDSDFIYKRPLNYYEPNDSINDVKFYTGATEADILIDGGLDDNDEPIFFVSKKEKEAMLYSLEDCFSMFRPRSGINKARLLDGYLHFDNQSMFDRPRYYMGHKDDIFKYWSSYRLESNIERGISKSISGRNYVDDASPFVVYKKPVTANRIVVKMQTGVGNTQLGPFSNSSSSTPDPFFGPQNQATPTEWRIQYLDNNSWEDAIVFNQSSTRASGANIIGPDGYVEIAYGLIVPRKFRGVLSIVGSFTSESLLPLESEFGDAFLVGASTTAAGMVYVWNGVDYESFPAQYGWFLLEEDEASLVGVTENLTNSPFFVENGRTVFREVSKISGIRVVATVMNKPKCSLDIIEISPRLVVNLTDRTKSFTITKSASDLGITGLPVGQLLASIGTISIFDYDSAFNENNLESIVSQHLSQNLKISFFEEIALPNQTKYFIPLKTMYADGFPTTSVQERDVSIALRDLFFRLESLQAPELFLQNVSMSYAVCALLDSIGFSNYTIKRLPNEADVIIPAFFVQPGKTVAEVLQDIAISTQTAMFFNEYNNFVMMTKGYLMPSEDERSENIVLRGTKDFEQSGIKKNANTQQNLANIQAISSVADNLYNDGVIRYYTRHIQKSYGSLKQSTFIDRDKSWIYKPVLLWEVGASEKIKSQGDDAGQQSGFVLSAIPLNSELSSSLPTVVNGEIIDNIIDFGDGVYWLARYNGYFFSNGEVIRYDAAEYSVSGIGNVWITNAQEYNKYFSEIPFNGKMYPTGRVRIFSEPNVDIVDGISIPKNGPVAKHGRGQFGTQVVSHSAGISDYWVDNDPTTSPVRGCDMKSEFLFSNTSDFFITDVYSEMVVSVDIALSSANGSTDTYTLASANSLPEVDSYVTITGFTPESANVTRARVIEKTSTTFKVDANISSSTGGSGKIETVVVPDGIGTTSENRIYVPDATRLKIGLAVSLEGGTGRFSGGSKINGINLSENFFTVDKPLLAPLLNPEIYANTDFINTIRLSTVLNTTTGPAGKNNDLARKSSRNGIIKNFMSASPITETEANRLRSTQTGTIQSSALVMEGPQFTSTQEPINFISYVKKPLNNKFTHFGTRMRIIGRISGADDKQSPVGAMPYYSVTETLSDTSITVSGGSGGIGVLVNPETNNGYYFEIVSLTENNISKYQGSEEIHNVVFYKVMKDASTEASSESSPAIPVKLWGGTAPIVVDDGLFTGQARVFSEENPSVYDLSVEYEKLADNSLKFYLYINNRLVGVVEDKKPLSIYNNVALFVRGTSRVMFENIFAMSQNYSETLVNELGANIGSAFNDQEVTINDAFRRYAISGMVNSAYLSGVSQSSPNKYSIYFDEFGTIMREAAYFNIKYDRAYPALYAQVSPTLNNTKGYTVGNFMSGPYGAEFIVFNNTDAPLNLDETSGNYLRIQGVTFTQQSQFDLSVDEFLGEKSRLSTVLFDSDSTIQGANIAKQQMFELQNSRSSYGKRQFSIEPLYVQTQDDASELMSWLLPKVSKKRRSVGVSVFGLPILQLGDIVKIDYKDSNGVSEVADENSRFVVYSIEYSRDSNGPSMQVYLSEVI